MADRRALVAVLLSVAVTAGCGVAETRQPVDIGDAAVGNSFTGGVVRNPPEPRDAVDPTQLVLLYLKAAVGDPKESAKRVRAFFDPKTSWEESTDLDVVRIIGELLRKRRGSNEYDITARLQRVGTMTADGAFAPASPVAAPSPVTFRVREVEGTPRGFRLVSAPNGLMITDTTLEEYYQPSTIYFWNQDRTGLVPDVRYVPLTMQPSARLNQVVEWQLAGPSAWLAPAAPFEQGVKLKDAVVVNDGRVVVNLSSAASGKPEELQRLANQLRWTLRAHVTRPLELQIEGQTQPVDGDGDEYESANPAAADRPPALFSVDRRLHKVASKDVRPEVISSPANANISYAAISSDPYNVAAFVSRDHRQLSIAWVSSGEQDRGGKKDVRVPNLPTPIGRPVWIPGGDSQRFLVPAGGELWVVGPKSRKERVSGIRDVRSVSVSPDGRRVALAAGGRAFVAALSVTNTVKIGSQPRELVPGRLSVAAVAWVSESKVLVAGAQGANAAALFRASADGAVAVDESPTEEAGLTDVIAFPDRTWGPSGLADPFAQTADAVYRVFGNRLEASDLVRPFYAG